MNVRMEWLYAQALRCYPPEFRASYAKAMEQSFRDALRDDVHEHRVGAQVRGGERGALRGRRRCDLHAVTRLDEIHGHEADDQSERRHHLEIHDRPERQPADAREIVAVSRDADHEHAEDQRRDERTDHPQENRRQNLEMDRDARGEPPDQRPRDHREHDPLRQGDAAQPAPDRAHRRHTPEPVDSPVGTGAMPNDWRRSAEWRYP